MPKKVLLIDDDKDIISFLTILLEDNGYQSISAIDGDMGFIKAISEKPDLICLDITMPNVSGVKCYRNLSETAETKEIPVFIVTGISKEFKGFIESRKQVPPPVAYFEKPIDKEEFIEKIKATLGC